MNNELLTVLEYMERERGIEREQLIVAVEAALLSASKKSVGPAQDLRIEINRKTCDIRALAKVQVVEQITAPTPRLCWPARGRSNPTPKSGTASKSR